MLEGVRWEKIEKNKTDLEFGGGGDVVLNGVVTVGQIKKMEFEEGLEEVRE